MTPTAVGRAALVATLVCALGAAGSLSACIGGSTPARSYFSLTYPRGEAVRRYAAPRYPVILRVRRVQAAVAYDRQEMVYRETPYELRYDWYRLWTAKPGKMVGALLVDHLRDANLFREVVTRIAAKLPIYELGCEVEAIEELDATKDVWHARMAMRCTLFDFETGAPLWTYDFDDSRRVYERQPAFVVRTLSAVLEARARDLVDQLDAFLAGTRQDPAPPRVDGVVPRPADTPAEDGAATTPAGPVQPSARLKPRGKR